MSSEHTDRLASEIERGGRAYVRNLAAAEAAVLRGQFNAAKVLRAMAHAQRARALQAARVVARDAYPEELFEIILAELDADSSTASAVVAERAKDIARRALESIRRQSDVKEKYVAQSIWGCYGCGYLVEGDRPDSCPNCGALGVEFEWFGPFYSTTPEHLGQLNPTEIIAIVDGIPDEVEAALVGVDEPRLRYKRSPQEWCVKEIAGHMLETHLLFVRRVAALREEQGVPQLDTPIPPWKLQEGKGYERLSAEELLRRMRETSSTTIELLRGLDPEDWTRRGMNRGSTTTLLDLGTWLANHDRGHLAQIQQLARA